MLNKKILCGAVVATFMAGAGAGFMVSPRVMAAAAEDPAVLAAAKLGITAFENDAQVGGGGAPEKLLLDNASVRVNLVSFPKGFDRPGMLKRRNDQLLVYVDPGDYTITRSGMTGEKTAPSATPRKPLEPGTVVFHPRGSVVSDSHINNAYRVLFVEIKK